MTDLSDDRKSERAGGDARISADERLEETVKVKRELFTETAELQNTDGSQSLQYDENREKDNGEEVSCMKTEAFGENTASGGDAVFDMKVSAADREQTFNDRDEKPDAAKIELADTNPAGRDDTVSDEDDVKTKSDGSSDRRGEISSYGSSDNEQGSGADNKTKRNPRFAKSALLKMTLCAVFIGLAVVAKLFLSIKIPLLGADGMRISLAGVFTAFPAFICGPIYGGIASAASDFIGYVIKPDGAYIPWLTLTAFAGGVLKGLIWRLFVRRPRKSVRVLALSAFVILGALGLTIHISLISDGILNDITASQAQLATRGRMDSLEKNVFSGAVVNLAKYNNDVFTVTAVSDGETVVLPSRVDLDGYERPVTKIGGGAFSSCRSVKRIYIPSVYTTIDKEAFTGIDFTGIVIVSDKNSAAEKFASQNGIAFEEGECEEITLKLASVYNNGSYSVSGLQSGGFTIKSSDAYRKNLCGYISFTTVGLELIALIGILYFVLEAVISRYEASGADISSKDGKQKKKKILGHIVNPQLVKIMLSTVISGLVVTTVNTKILQAVLAVYSGRSFIILWIPRFVEELAVCMVQSVLISVLYGVYISTVGKKTQRILDGKEN